MIHKNTYLIFLRTDLRVGWDLADTDWAWQNLALN